MVDTIEYYQVPIPLDASDNLKDALVEINRILLYVLQNQAKMRGLDGLTPEFASDVDLGGHKIIRLDTGADVADSIRRDQAVLSVVGTTNQIIVTENGDGTFTLSIASSLIFPGSVATQIATKTTNYTLTATDHTILADASSAAFTLSLPTAVGITREYHIKKIDSSSNVVSLVTNGTEEIDGSNSLNLTTQYEAIIVKSNSANWWIF